MLAPFFAGILVGFVATIGTLLLFAIFAVGRRADDEAELAERMVSGGEGVQHKRGNRL